MQTLNDRLVRIRMAIPDLPELPFSKPEPTHESELVTLGLEAKTLLNYRQLHSALSTSSQRWEYETYTANKHYEYKCKQVAPQIELAKALAELEIDILDPGSVARYKERKLRSKSFSSILRTNGQTDSIPKFEWRKVSISEYPLPIPEFALRKAVQLKRLLPYAQFWIEELVEAKTAHVDDPFLIVEYDGLPSYMRNRFPSSNDYYIQIKSIEYYIEVWNEPKFEATL